MLYTVTSHPEQNEGSVAQDSSLRSE